MVSVGIDIGAQFLKILVLRDEVIVATSIAALGTEAIENAGYASYKNIMEKANIATAGVECVTVTGIGREYIDFADYQVSEALCSARGVDWLSPGTDVLLDMGTEKTMVVKIQNGKPIQIQRNDRCASGTGRFLTITAKPLGVSAEELGELAARSTKDIHINSNCTVFAESEIISLIHHKEQPEDIAWAIFKSMAAKAYPLLIKVEPIESLMMIGWLAKNNGMVEAMKAVTGYDVLIPQSLDPQLVTTLGAALIGCDKYKKNF
jgi:(R)-2-hydroxyacyl-CoA dehydratese activating ATPase